MHTIPSAYYTLDSSARTITLSGIYTTVEFSQIISITDLTTSDNLYDVGINRDGVSMAGSVITYNTDNSVPADADILRIIVDDVGVLLPGSNLIGKVNIQTNDADVSVQNPFPSDGDSVYAKDIDTDRSVLNGFSGTIIDLFDDADSLITDGSASDPKSYSVYFKRPLTTSEITVAAGQTGNFSNMKLFLYDISGAELLSIDNSTDDTKYTKYVFNNVPQTFIGYKIEFHTSDSISVAFNYIHKSIDVQANIKVLDVNTDLLTDVKGHENTMFTMEYMVALGQGLLTEASVELAVGDISSLGTGDYVLIDGTLHVQPATNYQMYLQSTDAQDSAGGTGVEEITVEYLSSDIGAMKTVKVIPTGLTQVTLSVADIWRVHKMYANDGHGAAGEITLTNIGETEVYGTIDQYDTFMKRCIFYVAQNMRVVVTQAIVSASTSAGVAFTIFATQEDASGDTITRGQTFNKIADEFGVINIEPYISIENSSNVSKSVGCAGYGVLANQKFAITLRGYIEPLTL